MVRESVAILGVLLLLAALFLRAKYREYTLIILPLIILPLAHLVVSGVLSFIQGPVFGFRPAVMAAFVDMIAIVVSGGLIVYFGMRIPPGKVRVVFLVAMLAYTIALGWAYIYTGLRVLFA